MQARGRKSSILAGLATLVTLCLAPCTGSAATSANPEYVDSKLCASCHKQIADEYAKTGMGRSFVRPSPDNMKEDFTSGAFHHDRSDTWFAMISRDGEFFQRRWQLGPDGREINLEESRIDYVLGSGNHARSYLHRTARGTLIELPLGWYPAAPNAKSGHWAMSPGSDSDHPRTRRFVSYKCMFCHNAVPRIPAADEVPDSEPVYEGDLPQGIDCQRCHGPGGRHIRVVNTRGSTRADVLASIVNPARLDAQRRMEVCMQCHLETSSSRIPASIVRFDRGPFSYLPGEPLEQFLLTFDHAPGTGHDDKFEAVSSVYRLRQSKCFRESAGDLTCVTCHNPHRALRGAEAAAHYDEVCLGCHSAALRVLLVTGEHKAGEHAEKRDCASCHMPKRRPEDTPGMVMTDHLIQRHPPAGDPLAPFRERAPEQYLGEVTPYYPSPLPAKPESRLYQGVAQVGLGNNRAKGLPEFAREMASQKPRNAAFYSVLGDAWMAERRYPEAVAAYREAVRLGPGSPGPLRSLGAALTASGQPADAAKTLDRAVRIAPSDPLSWYRSGLLDFEAGQLKPAIEKVRRAIALDPELPDQSRSLAEMLLASGAAREAEDAIAAALRADPYDDAAWDLKGRLATESGRSTEAMDAFERAIRLGPGNATHSYDYALALVRMQRFDEAARQVDAALRVNPNLAEAHELRAGLFERDQKWSEAAPEYRRVLDLKPGSSRAHLRLGTVLVRLSDLSGAREHLTAAAHGENPEVAQQANRMLARIGAR